MTLLELQAIDPTVATGGKPPKRHSNFSVTLCAGGASNLSLLLCSGK
ncbi:SapB/AmfS family lanthipeptide [Streptomyces sp. ISL-22]|nr:MULTISPECIES: SapB/AmfS family lanthipeptide [unclassified Streptomyces]MBT2423853.1 SapB/AmfS family lanthipeptide [Streptomyces sp. ISL-24]MBT2435758.1 SapB/AmfS family lanthipeptide [Streptomyces sp. ISL-22]